MSETDDFTIYTVEQLCEMLLPMSKRVDELADIYETQIVDSPAGWETIAELRGLFDRIHPIYREMARRYPSDDQIQQLYRDFRMYEKFIKWGEMG